MKIACKDVRAETVYDVLHDTSYRKKWDTNMIDTFDIGRLTVNADVGYYSCELKFFFFTCASQKVHLMTCLTWLSQH